MTVFIGRIHKSMWKESSAQEELPCQQLQQAGFPCFMDLMCESGRCACAEYGLGGSCGPVSKGFRCSVTADCAEGLLCVQDPLVTSLFPQAWCKGVCSEIP
jgi:hypothetical protein